MAKRKLLKVQDRQALFDIPADEDSLIRNYSLSRPTGLKSRFGGESIIGSVLRCSFA